MPGMKVKFTNIIHHTNRIKNKIHIISSLMHKKSFMKIHHQIMIFKKILRNRRGLPQSDRCNL